MIENSSSTSQLKYFGKKLSWILTIRGIFFNTGVYCVPFTQGVNIFVNVWLYSLYKFTVTDITGVPCLKNKTKQKENKQIVVIWVFLFLEISVCILLVMLFFALPTLQLHIRKENLWTKPEESLCILNYCRYSCYLLWLVLSSVPLNGVNLLWPLWPLKTQRCPRHSQCFLPLQVLLFFSNINVWRKVFWWSVALILFLYWELSILTFSIYLLFQLMGRRACHLHFSTCMFSWIVLNQWNSGK